MDVLLIEQNPQVAHYMALLLSQGEHHLTVVADSERALPMAREPHDIVLFEPDEIFGDDLLADMRKLGIRTPVIVISNECKPTRRVKFLDAGADDYLSRPFHVEELFARMKAVVRRSMPRPVAPLVMIGKVVVDTEFARVTCGGNSIHLTSAEYRILVRLVASRGTVVPYDAIVEAMGHDHATGFADLTSNTPIVIADRLRRKLLGANGADFIKNVRGQGYLLRTE